MDGHGFNVSKVVVVNEEFETLGEEDVVEF
jgi:hypothetical protein